MTTANNCDHRYVLIRDWIGDPNVIHGTQDVSYAECRLCGETADLAEVELEEHAR